MTNAWGLQSNGAEGGVRGARVTMYGACSGRPAGFQAELSG